MLQRPLPLLTLLRQNETPTWTAVFWALCGLIRRGPVLISAQGSDFIAACPPSCFSAAVMWLAAPALVTGPCACFWSSGSTASAAVTSTCSRDVQLLQEAQAAAYSIVKSTALKQAALAGLRPGASSRQSCCWVWAWAASEQIAQCTWLMKAAICNSGSLVKSCSAHLHSHPGGRLVAWPPSSCRGPPSCTHAQRMTTCVPAPRLGIWVCHPRQPWVPA